MDKIVKKFSDSEEEELKIKAKDAATKLRKKGEKHIEAEKKRLFEIRKRDYQREKKEEYDKKHFAIYNLILNREKQKEYDKKHNITRAAMRPLTTEEELDKQYKVYEKEQFEKNINVIEREAIEKKRLEGPTYENYYKEGGKTPTFDARSRSKKTNI